MKGEFICNSKILFSWALWVSAILYVLHIRYLVITGDMKPRVMQTSTHVEKGNRTLMRWKAAMTCPFKQTEKQKAPSEKLWISPTGSNSSCKNSDICHKQHFWESMNGSMQKRHYLGKKFSQSYLRIHESHLVAYCSLISKGKHTVNDFLMTKLFMIPSHQNSKKLVLTFLGKSR